MKELWLLFILHIHSSRKIINFIEEIGFEWIFLYKIMAEITQKDTLVALATPSGSGAIAVIRLSGVNAFIVANGVFRSIKGKEKDLAKEKSHTLHFGHIYDDNDIVDEVLASVFKGPHS